jgi:hypothetical protein
MLPTAVHAILVDQGYVVIPRAVVVQPDEASSARRDTKFHPIFGRDLLRSQGKIPVTLLRVKRRVSRIARSMGLPPPGQGVVIRSLPGCQIQPFHRDYDDDPDAVSYIVAFEEGSKISTRDGDLFLDVGDLLVFRGDFEHAGAAYENINHRIHFYTAKHGPSNMTFLTEEYVQP